MTMMTLKFEEGKTQLLGGDLNKLKDVLATQAKGVVDPTPRFKADGYYSEDDAWPLFKIAYQAGLLSKIPESLPVISYPTTSPVDIGRAPIGAKIGLHHLKVNKKPAKIAGYQVDFPLGGPASMVMSNAAYVQHYARLGFDILTYKTVRSEFREANSYPQWAMVTNAQTRLEVKELDTALQLAAEENQRRFANWVKNRAKRRPAGPREIDHTEFLRTFIACAELKMPDKRELTSTANSFGVPSLAPEWWAADVAGVRAFVDSARAGFGIEKVLIVSVMATVPSAGTFAEIKKDFVNTAKLAEEAGANIIELNFSCPNTSEKSGEIYHNSDDASAIAKAVRAEIKVPIFAKIGYMPAEQLRVFARAVSPSIDGITAINTVSAKVTNPQGRQIFQRATAGLSGWVIRDVAQRVAVELAKIRKELGREESLTLLAAGGVMTADDFHERLETGVDAVEICTGAFLDPLIGLKIRQATTLNKTTDFDEYAMWSTMEHRTHEKLQPDAPESVRSTAALDAPIKRSKEVTGNSEKKTIRFRGEVVRLEYDGFGVVKFDDWGPDSPYSYGTFTEDLVVKLGDSLREGARVKGDAEKFGTAHRILDLAIDE